MTEGKRGWKQIKKGEWGWKGRKIMKEEIAIWWNIMKEDEIGRKKLEGGKKGYHRTKRIYEERWGGMMICG